MPKYILKRLAFTIPTLWGVVTVVFFMLALAPGDPARLMLGSASSKDDVEILRHELGLDKPLVTQYLLYLGRVARLDFGKSIKTGEKVMSELIWPSII
ncbi:hypothetical protein CSA56_04960 [candidate division KSB3 bacterium]|uniref:ABC transporter type 1 GsiC-like N-terminal domain-containing protein n=1 Tax=candidate division KSB3 bacterium TaxID=2044937 RepID=A0A2G6KJP1_9BACT|nr:MAG: hypothetical protein CSA56_04960 [candidate division KSB3 bacterium]